MRQVFRLHVIASGSKGNASIVEDARSGHGVLIDCGISKKALFAGCEEAGFNLACLNAIVVTHEHSDHTKGLGVAVRGLAKQGVHPALYVNEALLRTSSDVRDIADRVDVRTFSTGESLAFEGFDAYAFPTSHDASFSCGFRFGAYEEGSEVDALGFMTDTGVVTPEAHEALLRVRLLALESNHDERMLAQGPYPAYVKARIASEKGHLSNVQSAQELRSLLTDELEGVVAMHVSENNNTYRMPRETLAAVLAQEGLSDRVSVAVGYQKMPVNLR